MSSGSAVALRTVEPECSFTAREALAAIEACSPRCASAIAWQAVEEFGISLNPPRVADWRWLAELAGWRGKNGQHLFGFGDTPLEAIEKLLARMGGLNG